MGSADAKTAAVMLVRAHQPAANEPEEQDRGDHDHRAAYGNTGARAEAGHIVDRQRPPQFRFIRRGSGRPLRLRAGRAPITTDVMGTHHSSRARPITHVLVPMASTEASDVRPNPSRFANIHSK